MSERFVTFRSGISVAAFFFSFLMVQLIGSPQAVASGKSNDRRDSCSVERLNALQSQAAQLRLAWSTRLTPESYVAYERARTLAVDYAAKCSTVSGSSQMEVSRTINPDAQDRRIVPQPDLVLANVDLAILKTATVSSLNAGEALTYVITVTNIGANPANAVTVTDTFPADIEMTNVTPGAGTCTLAPLTNTLTCTLGILASGESSIIRVSGQVYPSAFANGVASLTNTATVTTSDTDTNSANDSASVVTLINESADLAMYILSNSGDVIRAGENFDLTLIVDNLGPSYSRNVRFSNQMVSTPCSPTACNQFQVIAVADDPSRIDSCTIIPGFGTPTNSSNITCTLLTNPLEPVGNSTLPAPTPNNGRWKIAATYRAVEDTAVSDIARAFTQTIDPNGGTGTPDPNEANNEATQIIQATSVADIQAFAVFGAEVQVNGLPGNMFNSNLATPMPDPACCNFGGTTVTAGRRIQWDSTALNAGPSPAENLRIEVYIPYGASIIENTLTGQPIPANLAGRCRTEPAGEIRSKVICEYGTAAVAQQASVRFQVLIDSSMPPGTQLSFESRAFSETFDSNTSNNITAIQFDDNNWADMSLVKTAEGPMPWRAGETRTYKYVITNKGPSYAKDARLIDQLPAQVEFLNAVMTVEGQAGFDNVPCAATSNNALVCPLGDIPPTPSTSLKPTVYVNVRIDSDVAGGTNIINSASIASDSGEPFLADNTATVNVVISAILQVDLDITKSAPLTAAVGDTITYTIDVTNLGNMTAHNVKAFDYINADLQILSIVPTQGNCLAGVPGDPLRPATCNLGNLAASGTASITIVARIRNTSQMEMIFNDVQTSGDDADENSTNNIFTVSTAVCNMGISPATLPDGELNQPYDQTVSPVGGTGPFTFAVTSGALPSQLQLDSNTGQITGSPDTVESANFTITVTDSAGCTASQSYTVQIIAVFFHDDFEDGTIDDWTKNSGNWSVVTGAAKAKDSTKADKAEMTSPAFSCSECTFEATMSIGTAGRISILGWYAGSSYLEVRLMQDSQKFYAIQKSGATTSTALNLSASIVANQMYTVKAKYVNATNKFELYLDGVLMGTIDAVAVPAGNVRFRVKATSVAATGRYAEIKAYQLP